MPLSMQRASGDWLGLVLLVGAIVFNAIRALRRGKVEPMPIPGTSQPRRFPQPAQSRPAPAQPASILRRPDPDPVPAPWQQPSNPDRLREVFTPLPEAEPPTVAVPEPTEAELLAQARREIEAAETARVYGAVARPSAAVRLGLDHPDAWRRAIIAREILDQPVALR